MEKWNIITIEQAMKRFKEENGQWPTATQFDMCDYLPSARSIQRRYGGLPALRGQLGLKDTHFNQGEHRSDLAKRINVEGRELEVRAYEFLKDVFGEICVHEQKPYGDGTKRLDMYVYAPEYNFGVDTFKAIDYFSLTKNLRHKLKNYEGFQEPLFLVYECPEEVRVNGDKDRYVMSFEEFKTMFKFAKRYSIGGK